MRKSFLLFCLFYLSGQAFAQLATGTTSIHPSAQLHVEASNRGFLPPRVNLTGTADVSTIASPATGLLVFNNATAGSGTTAVTPGFYYYEGNKWHRVINQQPDATVEFDKATPTASGVTFTPNTPASRDVVYVSTVDGSQWTYNGSTYITYTPPASTAWYLSTGTTDAGNNKASNIYRNGNIGIGVSNPLVRLDTRAATGEGAIAVGSSALSSSAAGAGAIRYNAATGGGVIQYSNGTAWNTLGSSVQKATVVAKKSTAQSVNSGGAATYIVDWDEVTDLTSNFNPATGTFTAPRNGNYAISFTYTFQSGTVNASTQSEAQIIVSSGGSSTSKKTISSFAASGTILVGGSISFILYLNSGDIINPAIYHNLGSNKNLYVGTGNSDGFVNFSVGEL